MPDAHTDSQRVISPKKLSLETAIIVAAEKEVPRKPDPIGAINIAKALNIPCSEIFFVGDTMVDMQTAKSANMKAIGVLWGFRDEKELLTNGADFIVKHPLEILEIVNN